MSTLLNYDGEVFPSDDDAQFAFEASRILANLLTDQRDAVGVSLRLQSENGSEQLVAIPEAAFRLLAKILKQMSLGNAVAMVPVNAELTTQQAADLLGVSRPFLVKLIDERKLACRKVGTHRRVLLRDLMDYKKQSNQKRSEVLDALAAQAQELNMGY